MFEVVAGSPFVRREPVGLDRDPHVTLINEAAVWLTGPMGEITLSR
jgi:hypothetical protein